MPRSNQELNKIANDVIGNLWSDSRYYVPVYRDDIKTEAQANAATDLPLMYIWNERVVNGHPAFSFSVNGAIVGQVLEKRLPRTDPDFVLIRDSIMRSLQQSQNKVVMESMAKSGKWPSQLYGQQRGPDRSA